MATSWMRVLSLWACLSAIPAQAEFPVLRLLTYNIWGLPPIAGGQASWRYEEIGARLGEFDVVALQEAWDKKTEALVERAGFPYVARGRKVHEMLGGSGLITLSRFPIVETEALTYRHCAGTDCLAKKGALRVRLALPDGSRLDVYNTHLNAWLKVGVDFGSKVRRSQIRELATWIRARSAGARYLILGDSNAPEDSANYHQMVEEFAARDVYRGFRDDHRPTWDPTTNDWAFKLARAIRVDYVFAGFPADTLDAKFAFEDRPVKEKHLSDHYGIAVELLVPHN